MSSRPCRAAAPARVARALTVIALVVAAAAASAQTKPARPRTAAPKDTVLVRIGTETITTRTVQQRIEELPDAVRSNFASADGRQRLLERMVEERVWLLTAQKAGVPAREDVKRQLEQQRRDLVIRTFVSELMAKNPAPADSEAHAYYDEHQADYRMPASLVLSHLQLKTEAEAKRLMPFVRKQDWKKAVEKHSTDTLTRTGGGSLGLVTREGQFGTLGLQPALAESAFKLAEGAIGGPYRTDRGWHLVRVDQKRDESARPFDQVRSQIVRQLSSKKSQEFYGGELQKAKDALKVVPDSAAIKGFVLRKKSAREEFNDAQMAGSAGARVEAYTKLLADHPDSDVSPQAQFMIGFIQSEELKNYDAAERSFRTLLQRWPKSELTASAQWMIEHMRSEDAPAFMSLEGDSARANGPKKEPAKRP